MKKLVILLILISMIGLFTISCGTNDEKQESSNNVEKNYEIGEEVKDEAAEEEIKEEISHGEEEREEKNNEPDNDADAQENIEVAAEHSGDAEKVLFDFFDAMVSQDIERAREYVIYDDLDDPFFPLEDVLDYYLNNKPIDIIKVEELSEDMKLIYVNMKTSEAETENAFVLKMVNNVWYVANQGVISRQQSVYTDDQVKDDEVGIYLKDIYHNYNGTDTYVIYIVNNTAEKFNIGFVDRGAIIYENEAGKGYMELDQNYVVNPYNNGYIYFTVDSTEGPVKSITLKEVMLGLQPNTSDVEVFMGEMVEK